MNTLLAWAGKLDINWSWIWSFLTGPVITAIIWYWLDRLLRKIHDKSSLLDRVFAKNKVNPAARKMLLHRINTFRGLSLQAIRVPLAMYFGYLMLGYFNIDPKPLLAGIGVVGLGLSLAAQNILRDFLNGLFIVFEDQFNVGDYVIIGGHSGTVENFSMRTTRLRTFDGHLITIPNGNISEVVNSTKDFAVANVEVGVSYSSDIKYVMNVLEECAIDTAAHFRGIVVDEPRVQGILAFRDNDVLLRVLTKTMPGEQWEFERALRREIKERFDREHIDIPLPQVVVHSEGAADEQEIKG